MRRDAAPVKVSTGIFLEEADFFTTTGADASGRSIFLEHTREFPQSISNTDAKLPALREIWWIFSDSQYCTGSSTGSNLM